MSMYTVASDKAAAMSPASNQVPMTLPAHDFTGVVGQVGLGQRGNITPISTPVNNVRIETLQPPHHTSANSVNTTDPSRTTQLFTPHTVPSNSLAIPSVPTPATLPAQTQNPKPRSNRQSRQQQQQQNTQPQPNGTQQQPGQQQQPPENSTTTSSSGAGSSAPAANLADFAHPQPLPTTAVATPTLPSLGSALHPMAPSPAPVAHSGGQPGLLPPPEGIYRTFEELLRAIQHTAKEQGYGVVKLRASNYRDGKPTRYDLVCDRGGVKYNSTAKKRNPSTRKVDCPWRAKAVCEVQLGNQWRFAVQDSRHNHEPRIQTALPGQEQTPTSQALRTISNKIDRMSHDMTSVLQRIENRLETMEKRMDNFDARLNNTDARLNAMEARAQAMERMDIPLDDVDTSRLIASSQMMTGPQQPDPSQGPSSGQIGGGFYGGA